MYLFIVERRRRENKIIIKLTEMRIKLNEQK